MNLREIREECWAQARDTALTDSDRMWQESEMNRYINRIYRFIARETQCIKDSSSPEVCILAVDVVAYTLLKAGTLDHIWANEEGNWLYHKNVTPYLLDLDPRILQIDEVKWMSPPWRLHKVSSSKWQRDVWWERVIGGYATEYATDLQTGKLALNYRMETSGVLQLCVSRLPLIDLSEDNHVPEFRTHYHDYIINGVLMHMYRKRDAETLDEAKALEFENAFLLDVDEIKQQESQLEERLRPNEAMDAFR